jgi:putative acyl-CoA dehydrogenase
MPAFLPDGSVNAIRLERLKDKPAIAPTLPPRPNSTGAGAWRVGAEGRGIPTILEMVTLTRLDCAVASAGLMRAGFAEAVHHTRHRAAFGRKLVDQPLMRRVLSDMALDLAAALALALRLAEAFDMAEEQPAEAAYARLMTPGREILDLQDRPRFPLRSDGMPSAGNGFVEESALPRLYREAPVNAIWEGSGNVMALDVVRALPSRGGCARPITRHNRRRTRPRRKAGRRPCCRPPPGSPP